MILDSERESYENINHIYKSFRAITNIVVQIDCGLNKIRHIRSVIEDGIQDLFKLVKDNHPSHDRSLEFIRVTVVDHCESLLDWAWWEGPPGKGPSQQEIEQQMQNLRRGDWEDVADFYLQDLFPEDRRERWRGFSKLSPEHQKEQLQHFLDLPLEAQQEQSQRFFSLGVGAGSI